MLAAAALRRERPDHTLQTTALVNEAYLRLCRQQNLEEGSRELFLAAAATTIRRILVDHARGRACDKRQGDRQKLALEFVDDGATHHAFNVLELHDVLQELSKRSERQSRVIEMRFFGGLSIPQVATVLGVSISTVQADWRAGRAWCLSQMEEAGV
jgi:RNA polymerase sigma factor (TIGR02999 family)